MLNSVFTDLWDDVVSHVDDFSRYEYVINNGEELPLDFYGLQGIYKGHLPLDRARANEQVSTDTYRITNNRFYSKANNVTLIYTKAPPNITFPQERIQLTTTDNKTNGRVLASLDGFIWTVEDLITNTIISYEIPNGQIVKWDIYLDKIVALVNDGSSNQLIFDGINLDFTDDFIVNGDYLNIPGFRYDSSLHRTEFEPFGHLIGENYYILDGTEIQVYLPDGTTETIETDVIDVCFTNPYLLLNKGNGWYDYFSDIQFPAGILNGNYNDQTGWGLITQRGSSQFLESFYPDTVLDWPNTAYYSVMIAAMAVKFRRQVELNTQPFELEYEQARNLWMNQLERDRVNAYRIPNPYGDKIRW